MPRTHLLVAIAAATLGSLHLRAAQSTAAGPAPFELPVPTGKYPVGTTTWRLTDSARQETLDGSGAPRSVEVFAWYPASRTEGGKRAPYLREGLAEVRTFARMIGASEGVWDGLANVQTHAALDAAPASSPQKFPLLVFSHGYTGIPSAYTALLEDLASHGYAVLSVVHPYEATAATLADGRVVSLLDGSGKPVAGVGEVFAEWRTEDATTEAVTKTSDEAEKLRLLRGYLAGLNKTHVALQRWVDDTKLVLDRLSASLPKDTPGGRLAPRLDMSRLGVFGHSMGGVTAAQFCVDDRRCRAGLNLDGIPQYGTMIDKPMRPSVPDGLLGASRAARRERRDLPAGRRARTTASTCATPATSISATWPSGAGRCASARSLGSIAPARVDEITRVIVREYFDQELLRTALGAAGGDAALPGSHGSDRSAAAALICRQFTDRSDGAPAYNRVASYRVCAPAAAPGRRFRTESKD